MKPIENSSSVPVLSGGSGSVPRRARAFDLYLDLLKRSLTGTISGTEPDSDQANELKFVHGFIQHYIRGGALSMLPLARFQNIQDCVIDVIERNVPGDLVETGVWRGGACIFMRGILKASEVVDRVVWVADSFEGLPEPDPEKFPIEAKAHQGPVMKNVYNHFAVGIEEVKRNFQSYGLLDDQVKFLKGWFKDTLPMAPIEAIAVLRLDGDYYESTRDALINLFDKISIGGYVIVDDYGEETWTYCRKAVDEFRKDRRINDPIHRVDSKCYFWRKTR